MMKLEFSYNSKEILTRLRILKTLTFRKLTRWGKRTQIKSQSEYDNQWKNFLEYKKIYDSDTSQTHLYFDNPVVPPISSLTFKKQGIVTIIEKTIIEHSIKTVVEIGAGAGLNLVLLAPQFPDVHFYGIEPTLGGVETAKKIVSGIPNVTIIQGDALHLDVIKSELPEHIDLIFTSAVLEQLNNYYRDFFNNIFVSDHLSFRYFLFYEPWLEANVISDNYRYLVEQDYFRASWNYLNTFNKTMIIDRYIPALQPAWMKYSVVFGEKIS